MNDETGGGGKTGRGKGHPDEGETGLGPVSSVERIVARHVRVVCMLRPLCPLFFTSFSPHASLYQCCFRKMPCGIHTFTDILVHFFGSGTKHQWFLKDTSILRCWCRPCGWGSWALDTAAPVAASWLWSWSVSWALSCSAVSSFAWNWPWRWARPLPTQAPHLRSMRRYPSSLPAAPHRWPLASSALPPVWVYAQGPSPPRPARDWRLLLLPFHRGRRGWRRHCAHW